MRKQKPSPHPPAPRLDAAVLETLKQQMLANLADPEVAARVDAAEEAFEDEVRKAAGRLKTR